MSHTSHLPGENLPLKQTLALSVAAIGVVFGDIGTSVLYTFQECFHGHHPLHVSPDNIIGITSLILWSLIIVVTIKYVAILMNAENKGEGGILTLLSLVPTPFRFNALGFLSVVSLMGIAGAALLFGDGMITPAISVLSAVEGLEYANPNYAKFVVPGTVIILALLFSIQSRGTGSIGKFFGVIVLVWFLALAAMGITHLSNDWSTLRAFNPWYAFHFFREEGFAGLKVLGSVILAVTGGEALYADMGHFGKKPIRIAWYAIVLPALMLNYLGQAALLMQQPELSTRPFYAMIESGTPIYYALVILATLATIIASQALITGAFSLTHQAIRLGIFPRLSVIHTSEDIEGRVYVPALNWFLAISCIALVLFFQKSTNLAAAYGLAVAGTMLFTTILFYFVCRYRWRWSFPKAFSLVAALCFVDCAFLYSNLMKIPDGGYLPLMIGAFFFAGMTIWHFGRNRLSQFYRANSKTMEQFFKEIETREIRRIPGTLVVLSSNSTHVPPVLTRTITALHVIQEHLILLTVTTEDIPYVVGEQLVSIEELRHGVTRVIIHCGFMENPDVPAILSRCTLSHLSSFPVNEALYMLGRETFIADSENPLIRLRQILFSVMSRNTSSASDYFNLPSKQVIEFGAQLSV
jgi:KUP system potassium uptake protein